MSPSGAVLVGLVVALLAVASVGVHGLHYSWAEGTPGTDPNVAGYNVPAGGNINQGVFATQKRGAGIFNPIVLPANAVAPAPAVLLPDHGRSINVGGTGYRCGQIISQFSRATRQSGNVLNDFFNRPVIGIAIVDYGGAGNVHAFFAKSGDQDVAPVQGEAALARTALNNIIPAVAAFGPNNVHILTGVDASAVEDLRARYGRLPAAAGNPAPGTWALNAGVPAELIRGQAWAVEPALPAPGTNEVATIEFVVGSNFVHKRWFSSTANAWQYDKGTIGGECALMKLMTRLSGFGGALPGAAAAFPFLGPNAQNAGAAPKLVCVAEAAHNNNINVMQWSGGNMQYRRHDEVASCGACQSGVPVIADGRLAQWRAANRCRAYRFQRPANGDFGTCPLVTPLNPAVGPQARLLGAGCSFACNANFYLVGAPMTCPMAPAPAQPAAVQTCQPGCPRPGPLINGVPSAAHRGTCNTMPGHAGVQLGGAGPCTYTCPGNLVPTGAPMTCSALGVASADQTCVAPPPPPRNNQNNRGNNRAPVVAKQTYAPQQFKAQKQHFGKGRFFRQARQRQQEDNLQPADN